METEDIDFQTDTGNSDSAFGIGPAEVAGVAGTELDAAAGFGEAAERPGTEFAAAVDIDLIAVAAFASAGNEKAAAYAGTEMAADMATTVGIAVHIADAAAESYLAALVRSWKTSTLTPQDASAATGDAAYAIDPATAAEKR